MVPDALERGVDADVIEIGDNLMRFIDREVVPLEADPVFASERTIYDERGLFVPRVLQLQRQVRMRSAELGYYTMLARSELGGGGLDARAAAYLHARINAHYGPGRHLIQTIVLPLPFANGLSSVLTYLSPDALAQVQPGIASGEKTLCFALSEPDAGSDVFGMKTRARREGDTWIIDGTKQWITNAPYADHAMVFAVTNPEQAQARRGGITAFFVDTRQPGFNCTSVIPVMGHLGSDAGIVSLEGVRVSDAFRLGEVDDGLRVAMRGINVGRLTHGASFVGQAQWAIDQAVAYAQLRRTDGKPIAQHGAVQILLADSAVETHAARCMVADCAQRIDDGTVTAKDISIVKLYCTEMVNRVIDRCMQVHGAMGLTNALRLEAGYRWARTMRIPDGTSEIQRRTIAREMLRPAPA